MLPRLDPLTTDGSARARPSQLGPYVLHERLGSGGQACVYRARRRDDRDARDIALKRLHPHLADDPAAIQAFCREARIAYLLDHPAIRRVHALWREPGELFLVMEYVDGAPLNTVLRRASAEGRRLPLAGILTLLHRLCRALHYAHELVDEHAAPTGFVHRDVSPSNLIVTRGGRLKLIDLGVARARTTDPATSPGAIKGKYGYMAPEVMSGGAFDRKADVFSVGVVAWELLTLCKLFPVTNPPVDVERIRARPIDPPSRYGPGCPAVLDVLVGRALATDPDARWPTCAAMADALADAAAGLGLTLGDPALALVVGMRDAAAAVAARPRLARGTTPERMARGTPPELATRHTLPTVPVRLPRAVAPPSPLPLPPPAAPSTSSAAGALAARRGRAAQARRRRWLGLAGAGAAAILLIAVLAGPSPPLTERPEDRTPPPTASSPGSGPSTGPTPGSGPSTGASTGPSSAIAAAGSTGARRAASTPTPPGAAVDLRPGRDEPVAAASDRVAGVVPPDAARVDAADLTRLSGVPPRSRSSGARFRARLCIDHGGRVVAVEVLDGPERLHRRIVRALSRWRYQPHHVDGVARAACVDVRSRLERRAR